MFDPREFVGEVWNGQPVNPMDDPWYRFGRALTEVEKDLSLGSDTSWLDLGCHRGPLLRLVGRRYGIRSMAGIDDWPQELPQDAGWEYHALDMSNGFDLGRTFDVVSALEVLEHMVDTDGFIERCRAHLKPGGHLLISTPNINSLRNRIGVPLGEYPAGLEYRNQIHHVRLYNVTALSQHLTSHGFEMIWVRGVNLLPMRAIAKLPNATRPLDEELANRLPQLCGNVIVLARRRD